MELDAWPCLIVRGQVCLLHELMVSVGEGTPVLKLTLAEELPVPTHLSLELDLVLFYKVVSLSLAAEMLLRLFYCCLLIEFIRFR